MRWFHHKYNDCIARMLLSRFSRRLRLNDTQKALLQAVHEAMHKNHIAAGEACLASQSRMSALLTTRQLDRAQALQILQAYVTKMETRLSGQVDVFAELYDSLEQEQRNRLMQLWHKHPHRHRACHAFHA